MRRLANGVLIALIFAMFVSLCSAAERPNIVLILSDDQGYHDVSCYGSEIPTPHIDSIAREGAKFTDWYVSAPVCTPSRYSLLTGRLPQRSRGLDWPLDYPDPGDKDIGLLPHETTLAALLRRAGYRTALIGKWHLGHGRPEFYPRRHGFDSFYGYLSGCINYFTLRYGNLPDWWRNETLIEESGYATDLLSDEAIRFIESQDTKHPFFLYLSHLAVHTGKGWDEAKKEYFYTNQAKHEDLKQFAHVADPNRRDYSAMVKAMDDGVGRVLAALKKQGLEENTWVIFMSDNGGDTIWGADNRPLRGHKRQLFEGGIRVPCVMQWPGRIAPGTVINQPCSALDLQPTICKLLGIDTKNLVMDGVDISSVLFEGKTFERDLYWSQRLRKGPARGNAFRRGPWKFIQPREGQQAGKPLLFNLDEDPGEKHDLADRYPEKLEELMAAHAKVARSLSKQ